MIKPGYGTSNKFASVLNSFKDKTLSFMKFVIDIFVQQLEKQ